MLGFFYAPVINITILVAHDGITPQDHERECLLCLDSFSHKQIVTHPDHRKSLSTALDFRPHSHTLKSTHAEADEFSLLIETSCVVPTRVTVALVDIDLTSRSSEPSLAVAVVRPDRVDACPALLARRDGRFVAFVFVRLAIDSLEALEGFR